MNFNYNKVTKFAINNVLRLYLKIFAYTKIFLLLVCLWILFSGNDDKFIIVCGVISIMITFVVCVICKIISPDSYVIKFAFFKYVYALLRDIVCSTIKMVKIIYSEKLSIDPGTMTINTSSLTNQEKVLFANLITMTPGTFVIAINGDDFLVHALDRKNLNFEDSKELTEFLKKIRGS